MTWLTSRGFNPPQVELVGVSVCLVLLLALVLYLSKRQAALRDSLERHEGALARAAIRLEDLETFRRVFDPTQLKSRNEDLVGLLESLVGASELLQSQVANEPAKASSARAGKESFS